MGRIIGIDQELATNPNLLKLIKKHHPLHLKFSRSSQTSGKEYFNISKTKNIVLGSKHSLNHKPQLNLVEMTKLLGVTLDCKLSWSKHIDAVVAKMGRSLSIIKRCSTFLTTLSTRQVLQALDLSHLSYCSVMWSGATKKYLLKLQLAQNRAA